MNQDQQVEVTLNNITLKWYSEKGYEIPTQEVQLWATRNGERVKNGTKHRVVKGTKILVDIKDLPPGSGEKITRICTFCQNEFTTPYYAWVKKECSDRCTSCAKRTVRGDGSHSYWVSKLIEQNDDAKCDISGETDKRFLVLHHLLSRSLGGRNIESNYVILSANYHMAFHNWVGGTNVPCTKEQYYEFKEKELK